MFSFIKKLFQIKFQNDCGIEILSLPRSPEWKKIRSEHLQKFPECAVCGNKNNVVPHHIVPFHIDESQELNPNNLITLCEGDTFNCHLFFGHLKNWKKYNSNVIEDSKIWREKLK